MLSSHNFNKKQQLILDQLLFLLKYRNADKLFYKIMPLLQICEKSLLDRLPAEKLSLDLAKLTDATNGSQDQSNSARENRSLINASSSHASLKAIAKLYIASLLSV